MIDRLLAAEISAMARRDQKMRMQAEKDGQWDAAAALDRIHARRLKEIVREHGWPTIPKVGRKASFNAWLIAQHADHELVFQKKALGLLEAEYAKNKASIDPANIAFLTDRVLVAEGKAQMFGTQYYRRRDGRWAHRRVRAMRGLEQRRKAYGVEPFADAVAALAKRNREG